MMTPGSTRIDRVSGTPDDVRAVTSENAIDDETFAVVYRRISFGARAISDFPPVRRSVFAETQYGRLTVITLRRDT